MTTQHNTTTYHSPTQIQLPVLLLLSKKIRSALSLFPYLQTFIKMPPVDPTAPLDAFQMETSSSDTTTSKNFSPPVVIKNMSFSYDVGTPNIVGLDCVIPASAKVILVGANGAGKSTLMRILTGQIFMNIESDEFDVCGSSKPHDQHNGVAYLGGIWKRRRYELIV